ncbi:MAG: BNR repeat-containing protein [bacterium]
MKRKIAHLLFCCLISALDLFAQGTEIPVMKAWSKTLVNAAVFRRNSLVTHNGMQFTAFYDSTGYLVLAKRKAEERTWVVNKSEFTGNVNDAHNTISIMVDGEGYVHVSWDHHGSPLSYSRSKMPYGLVLEPKMAMTGSDEKNVTYPEFYKLPDGNLIFMYRDGGSGSGNLVMNAYDVKQKKWKRLHTSLVNGEGRRNAYWQACVDVKGTIHLSWVWRESPDVASNHDLCYACSIDGGETWQTSMGVKYKMPIIEDTAEKACEIPQGSELINTTSMSADALGRPYIATYWKTKGSVAPQYRLVSFDGKKWNTVQVSNRTTNFLLSGGGTKKIPVSRPQIIVDSNAEKTHVYYFFRDEERGSKVSVYICNDLAQGKWSVKDLTDYSVGDWEPSFDTERWKESRQINLFVQKVGQGDGEKPDNMPEQMITVLEWKPEDHQQTTH